MVSIRILADLGPKDKNQLQTLNSQNSKVKTHCEGNFAGKRESGLGRIKERERLRQHPSGGEELVPYQEKNSSLLPAQE